MSMWMAIENAVVASLTGLELEGEPALATVKGQTRRDRKSLVAGLGRERLPAAYVLIGGRESGDKQHRRAGTAELTVLYAGPRGRSDQEARGGGPGVTGVFALAETAGAALQDLDLGEYGQLLLVVERAAGSEQLALWEQCYEVRSRCGEYRPAFGGYWLVGNLSVVHVEVGSIAYASTHFAFPGVDGVFERFGGLRERPIVWRGQLRASDDSELNAIEQGVEQVIRQHTVQSVEDSWGRSFANCVARKFSRKGMRQRDSLLGQMVQDFELEFAQLLG